MGGRTAAILWGVASRISSEQHQSVLCSSCQVFSSDVSLASMQCIYTVVLTQLQLGKNPLFYWIYFIFI